MTINSPPLPINLPPLPPIPADLEFQVFLHSSAIDQHNPISYQRLSILGDAYLQSSITRLLFNHPSLLPPSEISQLRSTWISKETLSKYGKAYNFPSRALVAAHMLPLSEAVSERLAVETFQAYIGALSLQNYEVMMTFILGLYKEGLNSIQRVPETNRNALQQLNERLVALGWGLPRYEIEDVVDGPERFVVKCFIEGNVVAIARAKSHKEGQRKCAEIALAGLPNGQS